MKHAKHTPGPWTVDAECPTDVLGAKEPGCMPLVVVQFNDDWDSSPDAIARREANARLIASAPDLLEALYTISELLLDRNMDVGNMSDETLCETIGDIVTVAIGKTMRGTK